MRELQHDIARTGRNTHHINDPSSNTSMYRNMRKETHMQFIPVGPPLLMAICSVCAKRDSCQRIHNKLSPDLSSKSITVST